jgi:hypothetical protein
MGKYSIEFQYVDKSENRCSTTYFTDAFTKYPSGYPLHVFNQFTLIVTEVDDSLAEMNPRE